MSIPDKTRVAPRRRGNAIRITIIVRSRDTEVAIVLRVRRTRARRARSPLSMLSALLRGMLQEACPIHGGHNHGDAQGQQVAGEEMSEGLKPSFIDGLMPMMSMPIPTPSMLAEGTSGALLAMPFPFAIPLPLAFPVLMSMPLPGQGDQPPLPSNVSDHHTSDEVSNEDASCVAPSMLLPSSLLPPQYDENEIDAPQALASLMEMSGVVGAYRDHLRMLEQCRGLGEQVREGGSDLGNDGEFGKVDE